MSNTQNTTADFAKKDTAQVFPVMGEMVPRKSKMLSKRWAPPRLEPLL